MMLYKVQYLCILENTFTSYPFDDANKVFRVKNHRQTKFNRSERHDVFMYLTKFHI